MNARPPPVTVNTQFRRARSMPRPDNGGLTGARSGPLTPDLPSRWTREPVKVITVVIVGVVLGLLGAHGRVLDLLPLLVSDRSPGTVGTRTE